MKVVKALGLMKQPEQERWLLANYHAIVNKVFEQGFISANLKASFDKMRGTQDQSDISGAQIKTKYGVIAKAICNS
jgi:hypothetical protein